MRLGWGFTRRALLIGVGFVEPDGEIWLHVGPFIIIVKIEERPPDQAGDEQRGAGRRDDNNERERDDRHSRA